MDVATAQGVVPDRCEILQDRSTLVVRLTESLVARVVQDREGPRQGDAWYAREIELARFLAEHGAPVIPRHPLVSPGPYEHAGYTLNFWQFVRETDRAAQPEVIGRTLQQCHEVLRGYAGPLPDMAIPCEALELLSTLEERALLPKVTLEMLRDRLTRSLGILVTLPSQPLHGDAYEGNYLNTTDGLLWTDWEDTFLGPVEWDLACAIWNPRVLDADEFVADGILAGYRAAGGVYDEDVLAQALIARAAVMCAWYPILHPKPDEERKRKLQFRLEWLEAQDSGCTS